MSDSETTAAEGPEVAPEIQDASPAETSDSSSPTTPETSANVAPTRKARRRPEVKAAAEAEETPSVQEQPAEALMRLLLYILEMPTMAGKPTWLTLSRLTGLTRQT